MQLLAVVIILFKILQPSYLILQSVCPSMVCSVPGKVGLCGIHSLGSPACQLLGFWKNKICRLGNSVFCGTVMKKDLLCGFSRHHQKLATTQCPTTGEWVEHWQIHTMQYLSPIQRTNLWWIHQGRISNALSQRKEARLKRLHTISLHSYDILEKAI